MISGVEILVKLNTGTTVVGISAVTVLALPRDRRRTLAALGGSFAVTALTLWLLAGQRVGDLGAFAHTALAVISGYSQAMGLEDSGRYWEYWAAAGLVALGFLAVGRAGRSSTRPRRAGLVAVWALVSFLTFKQGFVRHDAHATLFLATMLGALVGFRWSWASGSPAR